MKDSEEQNTSLMNLKSLWTFILHLETIEVCVESISALNVGNQPHGQLFVILISDVHHGGDVQRKTFNS